MKEETPEKKCPSCGCEKHKTIPFTDGKNIKWIFVCRNCETLTDERVIEAFYEPYKKKGDIYPISFISTILTSLF
jgi:hypothetical protein